MTEDFLERKIKKMLYGKPQSVEVTFPPGLGKAASNEVEFILQHLWFPQKYTSEITRTESCLRIDNIHLFAVTELLLRALCITDIRLILLESKVVGNFSFAKKCGDIPWPLYLTKALTVKVKVDSIASRAFHETGLKEILSDILEKDATIVSGENANEETAVYASLLKNKLRVSLSLAGVPLYKRGYRGVLSSSAPLREDAASACIENALAFAKSLNNDYVPDTVFVPFSGTGTFVFEYVLRALQIAPGLLGRGYALQKMPFFREKNFDFLLKKAREQCGFEGVAVPQFYCMDTSKSANEAMLANVALFKTAAAKNNAAVPRDILSSHLAEQDFLKTDFQTFFADGQVGNLFMALNPPYGVRFGKSQDTLALYQKIAKQLNQIASLPRKNQKHLAGFILCPSEESWSQFCRTLTQAEMKTYHFTQGGLDIRVCQFFF